MTALASVRGVDFPAPSPGDFAGFSKENTENISPHATTCGKNLFQTIINIDLSSMTYFVRHILVF